MRGRVRLGFEVCVDALAEDAGSRGQNEVWIPVTQAQAAHLRLQAGTEIRLRPALEASSTVGAR